MAYDLLQVVRESASQVFLSFARARRPLSLSDSLSVCLSVCLSLALSFSLGSTRNLFNSKLLMLKSISDPQMRTSLLDSLAWQREQRVEVQARVAG